MSDAFDGTDVDALAKMKENGEISEEGFQKRMDELAQQSMASFMASMEEYQKTDRGLDYIDIYHFILDSFVELDLFEAEGTLVSIFTAPALFLEATHNFVHPAHFLFVIIIIIKFRTEEAQKAFNYFDSDGSGSIDAVEFQRLVFELGSVISDEEADKVLKELDTGALLLVNLSFASSSSSFTYLLFHFPCTPY